MKLSIIIPVYNGEKFIKKCLESILTQNVDMEIIIVDDHSTDNTYSICEEYEKKYKCIKLTRDLGKGLSDARNHGLKYVTGDVITFCDCDDYYLPNSLKNVMDSFTNNNISIVISAFLSGEENDKVFRGIKGGLELSCYETIPYVMNDQRVTGSVWSKFFIKEDINIMFDNTLFYAEDIVFTVQYLFNNKEKRCKIIDHPCYFYYDANPTNISNNMQKLFDNNGELHWVKCFKNIRETCKDEMINKEVGYKIVMYAVDTIRMCNLKGIQKTKLIEEIKYNLKYLLALMNKNSYINNIKRLIYSVLLIIKAV